MKGRGGLNSLAGAICGTEGVCMKHDAAACLQRTCFYRVFIECFHSRGQHTHNNDQVKKD